MCSDVRFLTLSHAVQGHMAAMCIPCILVGRQRKGPVELLSARLPQAGDGCWPRAAAAPRQGVAHVHGRHLAHMHNSQVADAKCRSHIRALVLVFGVGCASCTIHTGRLLHSIVPPGCLHVHGIIQDKRTHTSAMIQPKYCTPLVTSCLA
jgi:hypothetical protein